jgi:putative transposase
MTLPRRITPGMTVMVSRRTLRRTHLLRPDPQLTNFFMYVLAVVAARHEVQVHAAVVMSTHEHIVLTDPHGRLPRFLQELHRLLALGVKVLRKWEGAVWDHEKTSVVELCTPAAVVETLAYLMANPVAAGLVERASQWPGVKTLPRDLGQAEWRATRPNAFFNENNPEWPSVATLKLAAPPRVSMTCAELRTAVAVELEDKERSARAEIVKKGWRFVGAHKLRSLSPSARARSWEPLKGRNPTLAVGRSNKPAFYECVARLRDFRARYRRALELWRTGVRHVLFPHGTYWMNVFHAACIAPI